MKRFIALVLSLVMALSLCVPAWGAGDDVTDLDGLLAAEGNVTITESITVDKDVDLKNVNITTSVQKAFNVTGGTLTLGEGVTINSTEQWLIYVNGGKVIVNGANINVTGASAKDSAVYVVNGNFEIMAGSVTQSGYNATTLDANGTSASITVSGGSVISEDSSAICARGNSNVTISGGKVETTKDDPAYCAAFACGGATITMTGGEATANTGFGLVACAMYGPDGKVIVEDGKVNGVKAHESANASATINGGEVTGSVSVGTVGTVTITGGTFEVKPADTYVAEGYEVFEIDEGGYLVAAPCSVTFDANGGKGELTQDPVPAGVPFTLPTEHPFTRDGYTFKGWATSKEATEVLGATYDVTGAVTFYAIWAEEAKCTGDSHVKVLVEYSGDKATKVYCDSCGMTFAFVQGTEEDAKDEFGAGNYVKAADDVWYTLKAVSGVVVPPAEDVVKDEVVKDADTAIAFKSEDAKTAFENPNADISTALEITEATSTDLTPEEKKDIEDEAGKADIVGYLDIDINVFVDDEHVGNITELPNKVKVVIPAGMLPEFPAEDEGDNYTRKYYVIRFHEGENGTKVDKIEATKEANGDLSFDSHLFSLYAIAYEDVATPTNYPIYYWPVGGTTTTPDADETIKSPETFDAGVALYVGMSVAAAVGTVTLGKKRED